MSICSIQSHPWDSILIRPPLCIVQSSNEQLWLNSLDPGGCGSNFKWFSLERFKLNLRQVISSLFKWLMAEISLVKVGSDECYWSPVQEILIKFLIINLGGKYEKMLWNPTKVSYHKKTHIFINIYVEILSSWGKYEEFAHDCTRNIPRKEYSSRGFRPNPSANISSQGIIYSWGIFLARKNIVRLRGFQFCE